MPWRAPFYRLSELRTGRKAPLLPNSYEEGASISIKRPEPTPYSVRFRARLIPSVDTTSDVKSWGKDSQPVFCMSDLERARLWLG